MEDFEDDEANTPKYDNSDIYEGVENLLSRTGPSLKRIAGNTKKNKKGEGLPQLPRPAGSKDAPITKARKQPTASSPSFNAPRRQSGPIDPVLLAQAFAYADKVAEDAAVEEQQKSRRRQLTGQAAAGSAANLVKLKKKASNREVRESQTQSTQPQPQRPRRRKSGTSNTRISKSQHSERSMKKAYGEAGKQPKQRAFSASGGHKHEAADESRQAAIQSLVQNFEQGVSIQQLRKELEDSKASLAQSTDVIKGAAAQFYSSGKLS